MQKKPPVVTIMGHVDHGKTSLLDFIRKTKLVAKEFGEITQAIGAYQIEVEGSKITFIDTPGHEAFSKMRSCGAQVADIVVLVVAANDGVMQQTKECIEILKEAKTPFIVAINKIDLPEASVEKVKSQLSEAGVFVEGFGGNVVTVPISAKTGQGVDQLLEMILLTADLEGLKADPQRSFEATVIESEADKLCGPVASLIIKNGSLRPGDKIQAGDAFAKVKMLKNEWGKSVEKAVPADPVLVLGFLALPAVGSLVVHVSEAPEAKAPRVREKMTPEEKLVEEKKFKIILKADVSGSLEAIFDCLPTEVNVAEKSVGEITQSDVLLAKTLKAEIYGFNLTLSGEVQKLAETEKVKVRTYKIIYDLTSDLQKRLKEKLEPQLKQKILGRAEILAVFEMKGQKIAGGKVIEGKINRSNPVLIKRGDIELVKTKIISLKEKKQDIAEAVTGMEFGAVFSGTIDFQPKDMIISFSLEEN